MEVQRFKGSEVQRDKGLRFTIAKGQRFRGFSLVYIILVPIFPFEPLSLCFFEPKKKTKLF
ncbi:hypothetical protein DBR27_14515 [Flavobacterium sp. HMWF030]|nr:hypothetical protein DBR27_14515 [Flavobacterium sp. HMWF030]